MFLQGIEKIYEVLAQQIEENVSVFVAVALESCFSVPPGLLKEVQRRRSTVQLVNKDAASESEMKLKTEVQQLVKDARSVNNHFLVQNTFYLVGVESSALS